MPRTWGLNSFLLEETVRSGKDALRDPSLPKRTIRDDAGFTGTLYYKLGDEHPADWTLLVNPNLRRSIDFRETQAISAVLFIRTQ